MKAAGLAIVGGLIGGIGKGMAMDYEERRQMALANLKRQWDIEDDKREEARNIAAEDRKFGRDKELLDIGAKYDTEKVRATAEENRRTKAFEIGEERKTKEVEHERTKELERLKSGLRQSENRADKLLADRINDEEVQSVQTSQDGYAVIVKKNGSVITTRTKLGAKGDGEEGGSIADARSRREGGGKPKPGGTEAVAETSTNANRLRTLYANATPQSAPRLFRDGKKIPFDEFERLMKGGQ